MPTFTPPSAQVVPQVEPDRLDIASRLMGHFSRQYRGYAVFVHTDNTVTPFPGIMSPTQYDEVGYSDYPNYKGVVQGTQRSRVKYEFLGGHVYTVDQPTANLLTAAGYTVTA